MMHPWESVVHDHPENPAGKRVHSAPTLLAAADTAPYLVSGSCSRNSSLASSRNKPGKMKDMCLYRRLKFRPFFCCCCLHLLSICPWPPHNKYHLLFFLRFVFNFFFILYEVHWTLLVYIHIPIYTMLFP